MFVSSRFAPLCGTVPAAQGPRSPGCAVTLLGLLNGRRIPREWANKLPGNIALGVCALLFTALGLNQLWSALSPVLGG